MKYQKIALRIPNKNGLALATELYKPEQEGKFPIVFIFHGFTGYKEGADLVDLSARLAKRGIVTVRFTASGFGDSEGSLEHDYLFSNYRSDAERVYAYVSGFSYVDMSRVGVHGHSMGGKLAVLFGNDHAGVKALSIVSAPVNFFGTQYGDMEEAWKKQGYFEKVSSRDGKTIRIPYAYRIDADAVKHDVLAAAKRLVVPHALVLAGQRDTEVPWQETKKIFQALGCSKEFVLMDKLSHKYANDPEMMPKVNQRISDFFVTHLT